jgi:hypothetical protein
MRNPISLIWWLFLLACIQAASLVLDSFHYLVWGRFAIYLIKACYAVFAAILFFRFRSFRSQGTFESMIEAYNRLADQPWGTSEKRKWGFYNFPFHISLLVVASGDCLTLFRWGEAAFRASILLDGTVWLLVLGWVTRVHWLKALGLRERLKEYLDNARSRRRPAILSALETPGIGKRPFFMVATISIAMTLGIGAARWRTAGVAYRVDHVKGCMEMAFKETLDSYYQEGRLAAGVPAKTCFASRREFLRVSQGLRGGEPFLKAVETEGSDFFGNGSLGDQGLEMGTGARFHETATR